MERKKSVSVVEELQESLEELQTFKDVLSTHYISRARLITARPFESARDTLPDINLESSLCKMFPLSSVKGHILLYLSLLECPRIDTMFIDSHRGTMYIIPVCLTAKDPKTFTCFETTKERDSMIRPGCGDTCHMTDVAGIYECF